MITGSVQQKLVRELAALPQDASSNSRRREIGNELAVLGDTRAGVTVTDLVPDIFWLAVPGSNAPFAFRSS